MKNLAVLGSTGSIGTQTLEVVRRFPTSLSVFLLSAAGNKLDLLREQIKTFSPKVVYVASKERARALANEFSSLSVLCDENELTQVVAQKEVDILVAASSGISALPVILSAIQSKKTIALANKEVMVCAGELVRNLVKKTGARLLPVDSEHNAIFQCLQEKPLEEVSRIILTASGGPFLNKSLDELEKVSIKDVLNHPTWTMGPKVTVDSSTLVNKGLELIEARWLFDCPIEKLEAVVHPSSSVHGMVEWIDGHVHMVMNRPSMLYPIQHVLTLDEGRKKGSLNFWNFKESFSLDFSPIDEQKFLGFALAKRAIQQGLSMPCFFNAANEVLVKRFLRGEISWKQITTKLSDLMDVHDPTPCSSLESILEVDREAGLLASRT
ncbi:1-deoxy-D-xylulose-5-phosphate reductoisomerase [Chlamydiifrater phoenicopteri]|uniref:1-deoxy-D-xylulose-5-phosphate reductoisomerase n=1 Tax=Chlamydiifrater phoenicopteri TaxID=2681469 RepID=UPI001BCADA25|nr:1-deoxy-D-xylulose-5-phosphate reductoisomerase [Chlamydiifrater phoenicopteri]